MTAGRRIARYVLAGLLVVLVTGYFAFATFLFSPIEGDFRPDLSTLIPRGVDFYASKAELARDFESFPSRLAVAERFFDAELGRTLRGSPEYAELQRAVDVAALEARLRATLEQLPIEIDPLAVAGGRDFALAGYFRGAALADAAWAAYVRTNWIGKLGVALLDYPGLLRLEAQGLAVAQADGVTTLSGGQLAAPVHLVRIRDVLVVGTDAALVSAALELYRNEGQDSFGLSARYQDHVESGEREGDEAELFVDLRALQQARGSKGPWPDTGSQDITPALLGRLFQGPAVSELVGLLGFGGGFQIDLHGELDAELVSAEQKRLYRVRQLDQDQVLLELAAFAPADVGLFACLTTDLGGLLRQAYAALDPATRGNLDDLVRSVWGYGDALPLIDDLETALAGRIAFFAKEHTYPFDPEGPPSNGRKVLAWAAVLRIDSQQKLNELRDKVIQNAALFGIQGRPGEGGVFSNRLKGGQQVYEYWSPFVSGTGHLSTTIDGELLVISNEHRFIGDVLQTWYRTSEAKYPRLSDEPGFSVRVRDGLDAVTALVWLAPRAVAPTLYAMADDAATQQVVPDLKTERQRVEKEVLRRDFPGKTDRTLTEPERQRFVETVDAEVTAWMERFTAQHVPALQEKYRRWVSYAEGFDGLLLELGFQPKAFELAVRASIPLDP